MMSREGATMLDAKIQTFLEVAAQGSYTRAAERLHLTQPAVTQQIHRLEEHYGTAWWIPAAVWCG